MWRPANKAALPTPEEFKNATTAITEVEAAIDEAKLRLLLLQKDLQERKAWLAPIRKFPAEILSEIFILMSEMEHLAPVTITEVCGLWRTVVLSTPRAWSLIYASAPEHDKHLVQYISTFIERSHPCLLHIWVPDTHIHEEEEEYEYKSETDATISLFLPYLSRIECISVAGWQLAMLRQESMPNLTRLKNPRAHSNHTPVVRQPSSISTSRIYRLATLHLGETFITRMVSAFTLSDL